MNVVVRVKQNPRPREQIQIPWAIVTRSPRTTCALVEQFNIASQDLNSAIKALNGG
jgi:hypothetical protein